METAVLAGHQVIERRGLELAQCQPPHGVSIGDPRHFPFPRQALPQQPGERRFNCQGLVANAVWSEAEGVNHRAAWQVVAGMVDGEDAQTAAPLRPLEQERRQAFKVVSVLVGAGEVAGVEGEQGEGEVWGVGGNAGKCSRSDSIAPKKGADFSRRRMGARVEREAGFPGSCAVSCPILWPSFVVATRGMAMQRFKCPGIRGMFANLAEAPYARIARQILCFSL